MVNFTEKEFIRFRVLLEKIRDRNASSSDTEEFMSYLDRFAPYEINNLISQTGFKSEGDMIGYIKTKKDEETRQIVSGLVIIGIGILTALILSMAKKKS
jgi:hypothetical protein